MVVDCCVLSFFGGVLVCWLLSLVAGCLKGGWLMCVVCCPLFAVCCLVFLVLCVGGCCVDVR